LGRPSIPLLFPISQLLDLTASLHRDLSTCKPGAVDLLSPNLHTRYIFVIIISCARGLLNAGFYSRYALSARLIDGLAALSRLGVSSTKIYLFSAAHLHAPSMHKHLFSLFWDLVTLASCHSPRFVFRACTHGGPSIIAHSPCLYLHIYADIYCRPRGFERAAPGCG
jgi:hypothetical protein